MLVCCYNKELPYGVKTRRSRDCSLHLLEKAKMTGLNMYILLDAFPTYKVSTSSKRVDESQPY